MQSESIDKLIPALVKAQGELDHVGKGSDNPYFNSKYADLAAILDVAKPILKDNGLAINHRREVDNQLNEFLVTILWHTSGQYISSRTFLNPSKKDPQGYGSAMTYARRYDLSALLGIASHDDDGNAASKKDPETAASKKKRFGKIKKAIEDAESISDLQNVWQSNQKEIAGFKIEDEQYYDDLVATKDRRKKEIEKSDLEAAGFPEEFNKITEENNE